MPSKSQAQERLMAAAAHNKGFAKKVGVPTKVAKEFNKADKGTKKLSNAMKHKKTKEGVEDRLKDLDKTNPVNVPAYQRKAKSGDSAAAANSRIPTKKKTAEFFQAPKKTAFLFVGTCRYSPRKSGQKYPVLIFP